MQITKKQFFIFVEGGLDRNFYDQFARNSKLDLAEYYDIRAAKELPDGIGGKIGLIKHFQRLKRKGALEGTAFGKPFTSAFVFDKDIDDLTRKKLRSRHAIYTETYDLEGHLLTCGDLIHALAISAQITYDQAKNVIGDQVEYLRSISIAWSDWIALCILSHIYSVAVGCSFTMTSKINDAGLGETNTAERDKYLEKLALKSGLEVEEIRKKMQYYSELVKKEAIRGRPFRFFRGKWIKTIFQEHTAKKINIADAQLDGIADRVFAILVSQVGGGNCKCFAGIENSFKDLADMSKVER